MMADSDAATALKLHTRMDIVLFGPQEETKEKTKTPSQTKEKDAIMKNMAKYLDEEKSRKYSRPYVLSYNTMAQVQMAEFAKYCKGHLGGTSTPVHANLCRIESGPESGTGYVKTGVLDEVLNSCDFCEEAKPDMTRLMVALVNQRRLLMVSLSGQQNDETKKATDQSHGNCEQLALKEHAKLQNVITFVEKLRVRLKVDGVLMGGIFQPETI